MAVDKSGLLWVGTNDGLNVYDGYSVINYFREQEPGMPFNNINYLLCDEQNRMWVATQEGVSWIDDTRKFHRIILDDSITRYSCLTIQETKVYGPILYTDKGQYYKNVPSGKWKRLDWESTNFPPYKIQDVAPFDDNKMIFIMDSVVVMLDYATRRIIYQEVFYPLLSACRVNEQQIAVGYQTGQIKVIDIHSKQRVREYWPTGNLDRRRQKINTNLTNIQCAANGDLLLSTGFAGLVVIDKMGAISSNAHDPLNPTSISANNTSRVLADKNGNVFVATNTAGINISNIYNKQAGYTGVFSNESGELFDNYINEMVEDKDGSIWIGAYDRLIKWNKKTNQSKYYYDYMKTPLQGLRRVTIRALCFDKNDRLWVSGLGDGVAYFDKATQSLVKIPHDTSKGPALISHYIHDLLPASDGNIWACTNTGMYMINPTTLAITTFDNDPLLKEIGAKRIVTLYEDDENNIWINVTSQGVFKYNRKKRTLIKFSEEDGLVANVAYGFQQDSSGNIYMGSELGFSMITRKGEVRAFTRKNGLRYDRCESFLPDSHGNMWIANNKCLIKFNPGKNTMEYYDENSGLTAYGFRFDSRVRTRSGEMLFGAHKGVNYFYPDELINSPVRVKLNIFQVMAQDSSWRFRDSPSINLPFNNNNIQFFFTAVNLRGAKNIIYQYQLEGYDKEWQTGTDVRQARYSSLPAGDYVFRVKASSDHINWINASNQVTITIIPPIWQRWWFIGTAIALLIGGIYWVIDSRNKKIDEQREEIEAEQAINYFASSMSEQQTEENILWDVAKNCIGRLQFEDCVIYLLDETRSLLIQKAAHGPKSPQQFEIAHPMEIPLGKGIVGSVALSGKAEIVNDTTKDARYIVDDEQRYSEISVPIVYNNKVLGVIDCEHSKKRFFTQKHLSILSTIASLCANKIVRARAEEEKQATQNVLMNTQQKMAEVEMQALRAQMNPHFIFNCLNSINRYIVKSDQATASLYLTRFAKLIRLILDNSNSKTISLSSELEALKLYIEMEALRFDKKFTYRIQVADELSIDSVELPPLIIQPYVENAIWHGLLHKEESGHLDICVNMAGESMLHCIIEDNGIGREKARLLKSKTATSRKSLGLKLTENRLSLLNKHAELNASIEITDLENDVGEALGTRVVLKIPV
jgi:putative methionine-R-sulfoxide reductase with GAF domain/sugar lactone lactonase YvrE